MANLELLRCLAMMMVVVLHFLGKGQLLGEVTAPYMGPVRIAAWILEALSIVAVNVYMLISGYFLSQSEFKPERLFRLWLQVWLYSVGVGIFAYLAGLIPSASAAGVSGTVADTHYFLTLLFPVSMGHYWFMTAYIFLYALLPFVGAGMRNMTGKQLKTAMVLLLFIFCVIKSVLPFRLETDGLGYDCLWYLCVFVTAGYIRRFGIPFLEKKTNCLLLYFGGCAGILAELFTLRFVYLKTGSLGLILKISTEYNHLFPFLAAVGLFGFFLKLNVKGNIARLAVKIAPYTLGVYLLHENIGVRYAWQKWFGAGPAPWQSFSGAQRIHSVGALVGFTLLAVICVFTVGVLVDFIREFLTKTVSALLRKAGFGEKSKK